MEEHKYKQEHCEHFEHHHHEECDSCEHHHDEEEITLTNKILTIIGIIIYIVAIVLNNNYSMYLFVLAYIMIGYNILLNAIKHLFSKDMFDENLIMSIATLGALAIGEYIEGIAVLVLYKIGEFLHDKALDSSKDKIESLLNLKEEYTTLKDGTIIETEDVKVGDIILVKTGEKVPLDSILEEGVAQLNMSALNGESKYVSVESGKEVLSGSINVGSAIYLKVAREEKDSTVSKIVELVEHASKNKSRTEKYISKFCKVYTPVVIILAVLVLVGLPLGLNVEWKDAIYRALNFLVISCPCALVISIPLGFFVGMGALSKRGIIAKGTTYIDTLTKVDTIYLDKTGTLTEGKFKVSEIVSLSEMSKDEIIEKIAYCESKSSHIIARAILEEYAKGIDEKNIKEHEEIAGHGIRAIVGDEHILCGNGKLLQKYDIDAPLVDTVGSIVYLVVDNNVKGYVILSDVLKPDTKELVELLHKKGIKDVGMLTGDKKNVAEKISSKIGMDSFYPELLPQDKVSVIEEAKKNGRIVSFVGDGINDSPVIAMSDVGMAMGKGTDLAVETADIVLMTDEPKKVVEAIDISRRTKRIVDENIAIILIVKVIFLICSVFGITTMWLAVFADVGITLITILNSLRAFMVKNK